MNITKCYHCKWAIKEEPIYFDGKPYHEHCLPDTWGSDPVDNPLFKHDAARDTSGRFTNGRHTKRYTDAQQEYESP